MKKKKKVKLKGKLQTGKRYFKSYIWQRMISGMYILKLIMHPFEGGLQKEKNSHLILYR